MIMLGFGFKGLKGKAQELARGFLTSLVFNVVHIDEYVKVETVKGFSGSRRQAKITEVVSHIQVDEDAFNQTAPINSVVVLKTEENAELADAVIAEAQKRNINVYIFQIDMSIKEEVVIPTTAEEEKAIAEENPFGSEEV